MNLPSMSHREKICTACRTRRCCSYYIVHMTGADMSRIAGALQLLPQDFVSYYEPPQPQGEDLFRLSPDGPFYALMLAKRELPSEQGAPCIFLLQTNDGHARCGLHDLRPMLCARYPVYVEDDLVGLINDPAGCVRTWSYGDIDTAAEMARFEQLKSLELEHSKMVKEWNRRIITEDATCGFDQFCSYLLNCCNAQEER